MATRYFVGAAKAVAQVSTATPGGTIAATDVFTLTLNNKSLSFTATTTTVAHVVTGLYDLIVASTEPEWQEIEATDSVTTLTLTARTAGKPFTVTSSVDNVSGGGAPTLTDATPTAASGPEFANVAANWSSATLPVDNDTIIIEGNHNIRYGLDQSTVTPARIIIRDFSGTIGLPPINEDGGYPEYRDQYMKYGATADGVTIDIDVMQNVTSGLIRINTNDAQTVLNVYGTGTPRTPTLKALTWLGSHASNVVNFLSGSLGIATEATETATVATLRAGAGDSLGVCDGEYGIGLSLTTFTVAGGIHNMYNDAATIFVNAGTLNLIDDADVTTSIRVRNQGVVNVNGNPTLTQVYGETGGQILLTQDLRGVTVTNMTINPGFTWDDRFGRGTYSNDPVFAGGASFANTSVNFGPNRTIGVA